jgi:hypothetical protein
MAGVGTAGRSSRIRAAGHARGAQGSSFGSLWSMSLTSTTIDPPGPLPIGAIAHFASVVHGERMSTSTSTYSFAEGARISGLRLIIPRPPPEPRPPSPP